MTATLERAMTSLRELPADMQEELGQQLLSYVNKWQQLKSNIDQGTNELARGEGIEVTNTEEFVKAIHKKHKSFG